MTSETSSPLSQFAFPRTGKRGVPQQFPRRLYEMLDGETKRNAVDMDLSQQHHSNLIEWSNSGKAFRIHNVTEFSSIVLPKYFRTKKFSSFQRNLNLYGFTKVRKGVDTDMYAHPSFIRDNPKSLLNLQKTASKHKHHDVSSNDIPSVIHRRSVSPSCSHAIEDSHDNIVSEPTMTKNIAIPKYDDVRYPAGCVSILHPAPVSPTLSQRRNVSICTDSDASSTGSGSYTTDRGKLDLLAFALEQEIACYHVHCDKVSN